MHVRTSFTKDLSSRSNASALAPRLAAIVGEKHVIVDARSIEPAITDPQGRFVGRAAMIVRPGSVAEVAAVLSLACEAGQAIVPQGGNTGLVGGQIAFSGEVILSLTRLNRIREVDASSDTMTCEAGVVLAKAQEAAAAIGRLFPLSLGSEGSCTIGGNLSANAGGTAALAYGVARDLVLGLEVVLPDGRILDLLRKLKKDNTGYDLRHIFIGAEGTLGVITATVLKLMPSPRTIETAFIGLDSPGEAIQMLALARERAPGTVTSFELIGRHLIDLTLKHGRGVRDPLSQRHPWYVLMEVSSQRDDGVREHLEQLLADAIETNIISDAVLAESIEHARAFWKIRHLLPEVQRLEGAVIRQDVSVPIAALPQFLEEAACELMTRIPRSRPLPFGHVGDGNIHFNLAQPPGEQAEEFLARSAEVNAVIKSTLKKYAGSFSAEHGIGRLKRNDLAAMKDPVALDLMRSIKSLIDPLGIMNPGAIL